MGRFSELPHAARSLIQTGSYRVRITSAMEEKPSYLRMCKIEQAMPGNCTFIGKTPDVRQPLCKDAGQQDRKCAN